MMTTIDKETRMPADPEFVRDVELIIERQLTEERNRRRRAETLAHRSLALAVAALVITAILGYTVYSRRGPGISAGIVRTRDLRLVDATGHVRGRWTMLRDGATRLSFLDEVGTERIRITLLQNGGQGITLADQRGEGRVVLSLEGNEGSRLTFADAAGHPRTVLGLSPREAGSLIFADGESGARAAMGLQSDGRGMFLLPASRSAEPEADTTPTGGQ